MHRFFVGGRLLRSLRGFSHPLPDPPPLRRGGGFKLQTAPRACLQFVLRAVTTRVAAIFRPHPNPSPKGTGTARAAREGLILLNCKQPPGRCGRRERRAFYSHPPQVSGKARRNRRHHPDCAPGRTLWRYMPDLRLRFYGFLSPCGGGVSCAPPPPRLPSGGF